MKTHLRLLIAGGWCLVAAQASSAAVLSVAEFNVDGDQEGFVDFQGAGAERITGETVAGGVLAGITASNDPQLRKFTTDGLAVAGDNSNNFSFTVADYIGLEMRFKVDLGNNDTADATAATFSLVIYDSNTAGDPAVVNPVSVIVNVANQSLGADNEFNTYSFDFSGAAFANFVNFTDGVAEGIRLDIVNANSGSGFEIDYIRLIPVPEPASLVLVSLGLLALVKRSQNRAP